MYRKITVLIPTKNRFDYLHRLLRYYADVNFQGLIFVGDSNEGDELKYTKELIELLQKKLRIRHFEVPGLCPPQVMETIIEEVDTPYCCYVADDDFLCSRAMEKCIQYLDKNAEYVGVHGRGAVFWNDTGGATGNVVRVRSYPQAVVSGETGLQRLRGFFLRHNAVIFTVYHTELFRYAHKGMLSLSVQHANFIFSELIHGSISAIRGKIGEIDCLYLLRQKHPGNIYRQFSIYDWLTDPDWFKAYQFFHDRVAMELVSQDQISFEEAHEAIRKGFWHLLENAFTGTWARCYLRNSGRFVRNPIFRRRVRAIPGIKRLYNWVGLLNAGYDEFNLRALLNTSSKYHNDFMPAYRAITTIQKNHDGNV